MSRALPVVDIGVGEVGEHAAFGGLFDERGVSGVDHDDDRAGGFSDDPVDQFERVLGAFTETLSLGDPAARRLAIG
jgi:hypothetical protein